MQVHDILSETDQAELVNGHVRAVTQNSGEAQSAEAQRLAMKFEGGWRTASYKRACHRREAPEG